MAVYGYTENHCKKEVYSEENIKNALLDYVYPVGSIFMSVNSLSPAVFLGGKWTRWGMGRVPVGVTSTDENLSEPEKTGGEKTHKLTVAEIPSHTHSVPNHTHKLSSTVAEFSKPGYILKEQFEESGGKYVNGQDEKTTKSSGACTTGSTGSGGAHNNMQPYITCYMWKRTA